LTLREELLQYGRVERKGYRAQPGSWRICDE